MEDPSGPGTRQSKLSRHSAFSASSGVSTFPFNCQALVVRLHPHQPLFPRSLLSASVHHSIFRHRSYSTKIGERRRECGGPMWHPARTVLFTQKISTRMTTCQEHSGSVCFFRHPSSRQRGFAGAGLPPNVIAFIWNPRGVATPNFSSIIALVFEEP